MPELAEVETVKRSLAKHVVGKTIEEVYVHLPKLVSSAKTVRAPSEAKTRTFLSAQIGSSITSLERKGKHILIHLNKGSLLVHLRMTGKLLWNANRNTEKHTHIEWKLNGGWMSYNDVRAFGSVLYFEDQERANETLQNVGADPSALIEDKEHIISQIKSSKKAIKALLLDQHIISGIGNIYADEILFASGIRPQTKAHKLSRKAIHNILDNSYSILNHAIDEGGSSISDYVDSNGKRGGYAKYHKVYGRAGKPCATCGTTLSSTRIAQRMTVFCKKCQK